VREWAKVTEGELVEWIQEHGPLTVGDTRYYVAEPTETKCVDRAGTVTELFVRARGDVDLFASFLVAQPFKPGAVRSAMEAEAFGRLFNTTPRPVLKEGSAGRKLMSVNTRFVESRQLEGGNDDGNE
jgi:hypothetical protein